MVWLDRNDPLFIYDKFRRNHAIEGKFFDFASW